MPQINLESDKLYFSADVPACVFSDAGKEFRYVTFRLFGTNNECLVEISVNYDKETGTAKFDIRPLIQAYLKTNGLAIGSFKLSVCPDGDEDSAITTQFSVLYANIIGRDALEYCSEHFLNDFDTQDVPRSFSAKVYMYTEQQTEVKFLIRTDQKLHPVQVRSLSCPPGINEIIVNADEIVAYAVAAGLMDNGENLSCVTLSSGARVIHFFIVGRRPAFVMAYRNSHNLREFFYSTGSWKIKNSVKSDSSAVYETLYAFDTSVDHTVELTSQPLDADRMFSTFSFGVCPDMELMLLSGRKIYACRGIVTQAESEVDVFSEEMQRAKLTVLTKSPGSLMAPCFSDSFRFFTNHFSNSFS